MSTGRKVWNIIYPILIYLLISLLVALVIETICLFVYSAAILNTGESMVNQIPGLSLIISTGTYIVSLVVFYRIYRKDRIMAARQENPMNAGSVILTLVVCLAIALLLQYLINISNISSIFPEYDSIQQTTFVGQPVLLIVAAIVVLAPLSEELLFRGVLFNRLEQYLNTKAAIIISALIFGALHLNMIQFIYGTAIGILFAFFYSKYRNIWIPILAHMLVNLSGVVLMAFGM